MPNKRIKDAKAGNREWRLRTVGLLSLVVLLGSFGVVRASDSDIASGFWKVVIEQVANKKAAEVPALSVDQAPVVSESVAGQSDLFETLSTADEVSDDVFGATANLRPTGVGHVDCEAQWDAIHARAFETCLLTGNIGAGSSTYHDILVRSGGPWYVDEYGIQLDGTVSSTVKFFVGTSTVFKAPDFGTAAASLSRGLLNAATVVTSTPFAFIDQEAGFVVDSLGASGIRTSSTMKVRLSNGDHLLGFQTTGGSNNIHGSSVTSTAGRGYTSSSIWYAVLKRFTSSTGF